MLNNDSFLKIDFTKVYITYLNTVYKTFSYTLENYPSYICLKAKPIKDSTDLLMDKLSDSEIHISLPHKGEDDILHNIIKQNTWIHSLSIHKDGVLELKIGSN